MVEVPDKRAEHRVDHQSVARKAEQREGKVLRRFVDHCFHPMETERDYPIHLAVDDRVMHLMEPPERRDRVEHAMDVPLDEVEQHDRDAGLSEQGPTRDPGPGDERSGAGLIEQRADRVREGGGEQHPQKVPVEQQINDIPAECAAEGPLSGPRRCEPLPEGDAAGKEREPQEVAHVERHAGSTI